MIGMTVCSGIGAPEVAAPWIDWRYQSEIEPFPCAVLAHRFPNAVNLGDMTKFKEWPDAKIDVLCGGTPCQAFSVAGLRQGLADPRGQLTLTYLAIAERYKPRWLVWENVPGVLSADGGRAFGSLLGGMAELGYGYAYRVLDAQYTRAHEFPRAVPQRRRRVFVVGYLGDWRRAAAVLFDGESLRGNPPPRREAGEGTARGSARSLAIRGRDGTPQAELGDDVANAILTPNGGRAGVGVGAILQGVAPTIPARSLGGGGLGTDFDCDGGLIAETAGTLAASGGRAFPGTTSQDAGAGYLIPSVSPAMKARDHKGPSSDGADDGLPLIPVAYRTTGNDGVYEDGNIVSALTTATDQNSHILAFSSKDYGADAEMNLSPTLRAGGHDKSHANAGVPPAIAIQERAVSENPNAGPDGAGIRTDGAAYTLEARTVTQAVAFDTTQITSPGNYSKPKAGDPCHPLAAGAHAPAVAFSVRADAMREGTAKTLSPDAEGKMRLRDPGLGIYEQIAPTLDTGQAHGIVQPWAVRRLTPLECERLQGFPDGWTAIPYRNKPADACPDGPRYKALGNSWAVNCGRVIFDRMRMVEAMSGLTTDEDIFA